MQFDFTAFDYRPSLGERASVKHGWYLWLGIGIVVGCILLAIGASMISREISNAMPPVVIAIIAGFMTFSEYRNLGQSIMLAKFATMNGMTYRYDAPFDFRDGLIFREGHSQEYTDLLQATDRNFAEIGNYQYVTGSGKNRQTHCYGFVRIQLPRKLPNMVLDGKKNNAFGRFSNLPQTFDRNEEMSLEGDFDTYFTLYAPAQYKTDALYIFTPDVMQALIDTVGDYDCEVIDDSFYIYNSRKFDLTKREHFEHIAAIADTLRPELTKQSKLYADDNVGNRVADIVAPAGARLKTRMSAITIVFIVLFVLYCGAQFIGVFTSFASH